MTDAPAERPASQRLAATLGRPAPAPLTDEEAHAFEAAQDLVDEDITRFYGLDGQAAA